MDKRSNATTSVIVLSFLVLLFAGQAQANFKSCMQMCILGCLGEPQKFLCGVKCIGKCLIGGGGGCSLEHNYCKLGCAMDKCSHTLSSGIGLESSVEALDSCVNTCGLEECGLIPNDDACPPS